MPPPNYVEEYDKILPGSADRLFVQMEANGAHRRFMDKATLMLRQGRSYLGLGAGLLIVLKFLDASYKLVMAGHGAEGAILGSVDLVALAAVFVGFGQARSADRQKSGQAAPPEQKAPGQEDDTAATGRGGKAEADRR